MAKTLYEVLGNKDRYINNIKLSVPLFIRLLEWAREDVKMDIPLHYAAENAVSLGNRILTTDNYEDIIKFKK